MGETAELPGQAGSVPVRRMRVAWPVGKGVMTTVDGDPADDFTLELIDPAIASTTRSAGAAVKLRWVSSRWNPMVTPSPVTR